MRERQKALAAAIYPPILKYLAMSKALRTSCSRIQVTHFSITRIEQRLVPTIPMILRMARLA